MKELAEYRRGLWKEPKLKFLFLELTLRCNERCIHCGTSGIQLCITGGEPLLRKDFFEIMGYAHSLGFRWGMTSNGTLIDDECEACDRGSFCGSSLFTFTRSF